MASMPTTKSEIFFYNLVLAYIVSSYEFSAYNPGGLDPADLPTVFPVCQAWLQALWPLLDDPYS